MAKSGIIGYFKGLRGPQPKIEKKSGDSGSYGGVSFIGYLQDGDNWDLSFMILLQYFQRCAPFGDVVGKISEAFSEIPIYVFKKSTEEIIRKHPILDLLQYPNDNMSQEDFLRHICSMLLITGNPLLETLGPVTREPLSLDVINPQYSTIMADGFGAMGNIRISSPFMNKVYKGESEEGRLRFRHSDDNELWPMFLFNPNRGSTRFYGAPIARPLYYDIEQYIQAGKHNMSLLIRGARPGGSFHTKTPDQLTDTQFKRMQDQIDMYYVGANNAGRPLLLENTEYTEHIVHNRDMDYPTIVKNATTAIYRQFNWPLPSVDSATMKFSNYETSQVAEYDKAVLPVARFILSQLTSALMYRYEKDWKDYALTIDEREIPELAPRRIANVKAQGEINVNEVNELRQMLGDEPISGGDAIYAPNNMVPLLDSDDSLPTDGDAKSIAAFRRKLESAKDRHGDKKFTPDQVDRILKKLNGD